MLKQISFPLDRISFGLLKIRKNIHSIQCCQILKRKQAVVSAKEMVVSIENASKDHAMIADELADIGKEIGVQIKAQQEEIFDMMHRL